MDAISFRAVATADLPLLHSWLIRPHVVEHWDPAPSIAEVLADYGPRLTPQAITVLDAPTGVVQYIAYEGDLPFGYCQAYRVMADQKEGWWTGETDPNAVGIDNFIGLPDRLGQGLGTRMIRDFVDLLWRDPRITSVQADPAPDNGRAIAAYRKAGFVDVGAVDTPDGPAFLVRRLRAS